MGLGAGVGAVIARTFSALENVVHDSGHQGAATRDCAILQHGLTQSKHAFDGTLVVSFLVVHALAARLGEDSVGGGFFLAHVIDLSGAGVKDVLEIEQAGGSGMAAEVDAIGREVNGQLREPKCRVPAIRPHADVDEKVQLEPGGDAELQVVDGVSETEMALGGSSCARGDIHRHGLAAGSYICLPVLGLVVQGELQPVGEKADIHGREDLRADHAEVEQPEQKIGIIDGIGAKKRGCSGSRRREEAAFIGRRQIIGKVRIETIVVAGTKTRQVDAITGIGAYLGHYLLAFEELVV